MMAAHIIAIVSANGSEINLLVKLINNDGILLVGKCFNKIWTYLTEIRRASKASSTNDILIG